MSATERKCGVAVEIAANLERTADAYNRGDREEVLAAYLPSDETTMVLYAAGPDAGAPRTNHVLRGIDAVRRFYTEAPMFKPGFDRPRLTYELLHADALAPDLAYAVAAVEMQGGDERVPRHGMTSLILRRVDDRWRIVHDRTH